MTGGVEEAFTHFLQVRAIEADVLTGNDRIVFSSVVIGEALDLRPYDASRPPRRRGAFFSTVKAVRALRPRSYTLTTGEEQKIHRAGLGMVLTFSLRSAVSFSAALVYELVFDSHMMRSLFWESLSVIASTFITGERALKSIKDLISRIYAAQ